MNPVTVAAAVVTFTLCCVAAYVLLIRQARSYEIQLEALRNSVWREASARQEAEALIREMAGDSTALDEWEQDQFHGITGQLQVDMGLEILGDEGGAA